MPLMDFEKREGKKVCRKDWKNFKKKKNPISQNLTDVEIPGFKFQGI